VPVFYKTNIHLDLPVLSVLMYCKINLTIYLHDQTDQPFLIPDTYIFISHILVMEY